MSLPLVQVDIARMMTTPLDPGPEPSEAPRAATPATVPPAEVSWMDRPLADTARAGLQSLGMALVNLGSRVTVPSLSGTRFNTLLLIAVVVVLVLCLTSISSIILSPWTTLLPMGAMAYLLGSRR